MSVDWDLNAVVRSCNFTTAITTQTQTHGLNHIAATSSSSQPTQTKISVPFRNDVAFKELQQQFFFYKPPPQHSDIGGTQTMLSFSEQPAAKPETKKKAVNTDARAVSRRVMNTVRPEHLIYRPQIKRKNMKKVVRTMTKESLYSDVWSWRKYGQKPIKGSPHPRNYYRCSSWRGCPARKQVERSLKNPNLYVVTFSGEHRHARSIFDEDRPHFPTVTLHLPPPPPPPPAPISISEKTEKEIEEEDQLFANLDEVDLFDGFFFD